MSSSHSAQAAPASAHTARDAYRERLQTLRMAEAHLQREHTRLGYLRLAFGLAILILLFPPVPFVLLPLAAFVFAARVHGRVLHRLAETRRAIAYFQYCTDRTEDRWAGVRSRPTPAAAEHSLYAADLDLFGTGGLMELLCEARTSLGEETLADWLLHPAPLGDIVPRQQAIRELTSRIDLREAFARARGAAVVPIDREALNRWARTAGDPPLWPALRWFAPVLVALTLTAVWRYAVTRSPLLLVLMLAIDGALTFGLRRRYAALFPQVEQVARALRTVTALLKAITQKPLHAPLTAELQAGLRGDGTEAHQALERLASLAPWAEARGNYVVRILDAPFLYSVQLALRIERWRSRFGPQFEVWLRAVGSFEALLSLSSYSFERPENVFPEVTEGAAAFFAEALGHPLLPASRCVRNNVALGSAHRMLLISGSNMSGKSTLLRSVGVNTVLALAGAPVCAGSMRLSHMTVAASIQVNDSLQAGRSRFYAEILRLRAVVDAARTQPPVLFLVDEVLAGTNSSDRLQGAQGLVRDLLTSGSIGLLSTHDLALTALAVNGMQDAVGNAHFQDEVVDGQLRFDYTLRPGPVTRSNGLALMRLIGLDV